MEGMHRNRRKLLRSALEAQKSWSLVAAACAQQQQLRCCVLDDISSWFLGVVSSDSSVFREKSVHHQCLFYSIYYGKQAFLF